MQSGVWGIWGTQRLVYFVCVWLFCPLQSLSDRHRKGNRCWSHWKEKSNPWTVWCIKVQFCDVFLQTPCSVRAARSEPPRTNRSEPRRRLRRWWSIYQVRFHNTLKKWLSTWMSLKWLTVSNIVQTQQQIQWSKPDRKSAKQKLLVALSKFFEPLGCYVSLISSLTKSLFLRLKFQALIDSSLMKDQTVLSTLTPPHFISAGLQIPTNNFEFIRNQICSRRQFHCSLSEIHFSVLSTCKLVFWNMKGTEDHL